MGYKDAKTKKDYNREYQRIWRLQNPDKVKAIAARYWQNSRDKAMAKGAAYRERKRMEIATRPRSLDCEICGKHCRTVLDHDHVTGKFRGWLCNQCNTALGHAKDNIQTLYKLAKYLENNREQECKLLIKSPIQIQI